MILEFSFEDFSSYFLLEKIFKEVADEYDIQIQILRDKNQVDLYAKCEDSENLARFADDFSSRLPFSIYIAHKDVVVTEKFPKSSYEPPLHKKAKLSFCPKCLKNVTDKNNNDYYNLFKECYVCGYGVGKQKINLSGFFVNSQDYQAIVKKAALLISQNKILKIKTFNGFYTIGILNKKNIEDREFEVLCYDLEAISNYTKASEYEQITLATIEKPAIRVQTSLAFKCDFEDINLENTYFRLPNDLILYFLMKELVELGINAVFISEKVLSYDHLLDFESDVEQRKSLKVVVNESNVLVVNKNYNLSNEIQNTLVSLRDYEFPFVVAKEYGIMEEKAICALYLSKKYESKVMFYSKKIGLIEHLPLYFEFESIEKLLDNVANQDEASAKLIAKYIDSFPDLYESTKDKSFQDKKINLYQFWKILGVILDIKDIEENIINFLGKKGPRIDYKLMKTKDNKVVLNPLKTVQSCISFKLAGSNKLELAYGIMESFVDFISSFIDDMKLDMNVEVVTINGSMLEIAPLFKKLDSTISKNHTVLFNKKYFIDRD